MEEKHDLFLITVLQCLKYYAGRSIFNRDKKEEINKKTETSFIFRRKLLLLFFVQRIIHFYVHRV